VARLRIAEALRGEMVAAREPAELAGVRERRVCFLAPARAGVELTALGVAQIATLLESLRPCPRIPFLVPDHLAELRAGGARAQRAGTRREVVRACE
jgi:hypothetical protein